MPPCSCSARRPRCPPPPTRCRDGRRRSPPPPSTSSISARSRVRIRTGSRPRCSGFGCFWGAERKFWELGDGIHVTAVGYAAGHTPNPTYEEVCSGRTGHNEVVLVVYDPKKISYEKLLKTFWESHDPTQGMRQGNDVGTQYRSGIYVYERRPAQSRRGVEGDVREGAQGQAASTPSPPRSSTRRRSISPRTITSSIWRRIRWAIAASAAPA